MLGDVVSCKVSPDECFDVGLFGLNRFKFGDNVRIGFAVKLKADPHGISGLVFSLRPKLCG